MRFSLRQVHGAPRPKHPLDVVCPACHAVSGNPCLHGNKQANGKRIHPARIAAFKQAGGYVAPKPIDDPLTRPCPYCHAAVGAGCQTIGYWNGVRSPMPTHPSRKNLTPRNPR